jgi:hypothetical protein
MSKQRDAGTGKYISDEQAAIQDPATWIKEAKKVQRFTRDQLLKDLYGTLLVHAGHSECEDFESVKVENITKVFKDFGLKVEEWNR